MAAQHNSFRFVVYGIVCVGVVFCGRVDAQTKRPTPGVKIRRPPVRRVPKAPVAPRVLMETSAPVSNLMQRAEDAIVREDWKLAIDSLQRLIDAPDGSLVALDQGNPDTATIYQSASRYAASRMAHLPPEGLAAYRLLYDGKAKRLYEQAVALHQADGLWTIAHRYVGTQHGGDALETLASWALDDDRPELALRLLHDLRTLVRVQEQDTERIAVMASAAQAMIGALDRAYDTMTPYIPAVTKQTSDRTWHQIVVYAASHGAKNRYAVDESTYESWPVAHGRLVGNGRLPSVSPEITSAAAWRYELDERDYRSSVDFNSKSGRERLAFPFYRFAIDGSRIFLRTRRGCVALDADDLSWLWSSRSEKKRFTGGVGSVSVPVDYQLKRTYENVSGAISVGENHVYTVEQALFKLTGIGAAKVPARVGPRAFLDRKNLGGASRLVARDIATGDISWARGGNDDLLDPLNDVRFRAAPLVVDGEVWVPYERQHELFLGVLDSATGEDIAHLFLCSSPLSKRLVTVGLTPAYQGGVLYVGSGFGVFYAIDVARHDVIWAHRLNVPHNVGRADLSWETGSPVVARGLVIFPSLVDGALYAFDVLDGTKVWSKVVDRAAFIIAGDAKHVWLAGQTVTCLTTDTGDVVWKRELPFTQTGRAALVGDTLLIPAMKSVLAIDAYTGELVKADTLAAKQHPLGDVVSYRSSLYSVDPSFVRRFPDLSDMYPAAKYRLLDHPDEVKTRLQLARLEILRGAPETAISLLESEDKRFEGVNQQMRTRTLVDAWLLMASEGKGEPGEMARVLDNAEQQATTNAQKVRVALAKSRWQQAGADVVGAAQTIWRTAVSLPDDKKVELGGLAKGAAPLVLRRELFGVVGSMDAAAKGEFEQDANTQLSQLVSQHPMAEGWSASYARSLRAISELGAPPVTSQRALLESGKRNMLRGRLELAEHDLVDCAGMDASSGLARSAILYLIKLHTHVLHSPARAVEPWVSALMKSSPNEAVPSSFEWFDMLGPKPATSSTLSAWLVQNGVIVSKTLAGIKVITQNQTAKHDNHSWIFVPESSAGSTAIRRVYRLGHQRGDASPVGFMPVIVFVREDRLAALHPKTGEVLWQADMRFPEVFPTSSLFSRVNLRTRSNVRWPKRSFVVDGQVVVVVGREGLSGIGLLTGKRLWVRSFDLYSNVTKPEMRDSAIAAQGGVIAALTEGGRLSLMRSGDGSTVWERDMYGETVGHIWLTPTRVITADARMQRVHIIDREDGRLVRQALYEQPDDHGDLVSLVIIGEHLYGPTHNARVDGLLGVDLISGDDVWERELDRPLVQLYGLNEHTLGVGLLGGGGYMIDTAKGYESTSFFFEHITRMVDLHLVDQSLVAVYAERKNRRQAIGMKAIDVATGEPRWSRHDLALVQGKTSIIRVRGKTIFAVLETISGQRAQDIKYHVVTIDADTGADRGWREELPRTSSNAGYRFEGDLEVKADAVLVGISSAIHGFVRDGSDMAGHETEIGR